MTFQNPEYFLILLVLLPMLVWHFLFRRKQEMAVNVATTEEYRKDIRTLRTRLLHLPFFLRLLVIVLTVVVIARPQTHHAISEKETEGIDIIMAMDISTSMLTQDIRPNRIEAAKSVANEFIASRPYDNIGLVLFAGEAFLQCPLTTDHASLLSMFDNVSCRLQADGLIAPGTAIGMGLTNAVSHLENSVAKSKVVILLTDGVNNTGDISPQMAAEVAKDCKVRVYTISLGRAGKSKQAIATLPNGETYEAELENATDSAMLRNIAQQTGGKYYAAESRKELKDIYSEIDALEKTKLKVMNYSRKYEAYLPFALVALGLLLAEILLRLTWLRRLP